MCWHVSVYFTERSDGDSQRVRLVRIHNSDMHTRRHSGKQMKQLYPDQDD